MPWAIDEGRQHFRKKKERLTREHRNLAFNFHLQHLRGAVARYLRRLHQGRLRQSPLRTLQTLQRLLRLRCSAFGG